jgi:hypothetical protein
MSRWHPVSPGEFYIHACKNIPISLCFPRASAAGGVRASQGTDSDETRRNLSAQHFDERSTSLNVYCDEQQCVAEDCDDLPAVVSTALK